MPIAAPMRRQAMPWSIQNVRDRRVGVREREVVGGLGMREVGRVEVEADAERLCPVDPAGEMFGADFVALDVLAAELAVERVEVEAMLSRG